MDALDDAISKLENQWYEYHHDKTGTKSMPDMIELTKLRIKRKELKNE